MEPQVSIVEAPNFKMPGVLSRKLPTVLTNCSLKLVQKKNYLHFNGSPHSQYLGTKEGSFARHHSLKEIARLRKSGGTFLGAESYLAQELAPGGLGGLRLFSRTHTGQSALFKTR